VDEHQRPEITRGDGHVDRGRDAETTAAYARVAKDVGKELIARGSPVVICDLWTAMMARAGWTGEGVLPGSLKAARNAALADMLYDGMYATLILLVITDAFLFNIQASTSIPPATKFCTTKCAR
jgi:hypothetical protein